MLDNPIEREVVKGSGAVAAAMSGDPLASVLATILGVAVESLGYLGQRRTRELFVTQEFMNKVIDQVCASDDFASFVYDVWMRHNFESSEQRRKRLRGILVHATENNRRDFENFTKIITAAQQIDDLELKVLDVFYKLPKSTDTSEIIYLRGAQGLDGRRLSGFKVNASRFAAAVDKAGIGFKLEENEEFTAELNRLCYLGLLSTYVAMDGEYYMPTHLGYMFLEYVVGP